MIVKTLYTCQLCNTDYADKDKAIACEKNHKLLEDATIVGEYVSQKAVPDGTPTKIKVKFKGSESWVFYRR